MAKHLKLVDTFEKVGAGNEKTAKHSRSIRDIKYNQYRIDQLDEPIEGMLYKSDFHRWEHSVRTTTGKTWNIKRTRSTDKILNQLNNWLFTSSSEGLYQDIYRFEFLGSERFKSGKVKKHHFRITVSRYQFINGTFKKVIVFWRSTIDTDAATVFGLH